MKKFRVLVNGSEYNVEIEELSEGQAAPSPAAVAPRPAAPVARAAKPAPAKPAPAKTETPAGGAIVAPMPGTVLSVGVEVGAVVTK